jgi:hypothetical protein
MKAFLKMAPQGRIRIILDNASLHHSTAKPKPEDQFEKLFRKALRGKSAMLRGKFGRYAHDKVFIVSKKQTGVPVKVLTGSTNFSVTGLYVNSNHVLIFNDPQVAGKYQEMFQVAWADELKKPAFTKSSIAGKPVNFSSKATPSTQISFAPHVPDQESGKGKTAGSVLFAVMQIDKGVSPVYKALTALHKKQNIFSYGISDSPGGICLYAPGKKTGVLVTGKPIRTQLPPPFNQIPNIGGVGHQVHHKFVVCGFNSSAPVVYCGSSNMAVGGEEENGDNLIAIHDGDVAVAFALEALALVDHFNFLDHYAKGSKGALQRPVADQRQGAIAAHWYLSTNDKWASPYFDSNDLHYVDRNLFG